jgi:hypothetical protein
LRENEKHENPRLTTIVLIASVVFSVALVSIRLMEGLPLGVDSTSHLFRIMLISKSYRENGYMPQWNPYWYGGTPLVLLYPPLAYYLGLVPSLLGLDPVLSYKLVDVVFYLLGPMAIYCLSRTLGIDHAQSILAAFFFSFSPSVVENYLFYDRFPSIISIPVVCLFLIFLYRALCDEYKWTSLIVSGILFGTTILLHHLSALCAALLGLLLALSTVLARKKPLAITHAMAQMLLVILIGLALSSFWLIPFIEASGRFLTNPFYNRNVEFPFIRLSYFSINVVTYAFGIVHFALSLFAIWSYSSRYKLKSFIPATFAAMLLGMALFESGEKLAVTPIRIAGQTIVVLSLFSLLYAIVRRRSMPAGMDSGVFFVILWFVIFFWLSLGSFALPFVTVHPLSMLWRALDVHRFWLYLTLSMSILSAIGLRRIMQNKLSLSSSKRWLIPTLLLGIVITGGCVKVTYTATHNISEFLPYSPLNSDIPVGLVRYFRSDSTYGRILALRCPLWVYVLPCYVDKPLIDGWYPQEKLIKPILEINDYRILDLESAGPVEPVDSPNRTRIWRNLILSSRLLAIKWVVIGKVAEETRFELFNDTGFKFDAQFPYEKGDITVYRTSEPIEMVDMFPSNTGNAVFSRDGPDRFVLKFLNVYGAQSVVIKEAYSPSWSARVDSRNIEILQDKEGFMEITFPQGATEVIFEQKPIELSRYYLSFATVLVSLLFVGVDRILRNLSKGRRQD